MRRTLLTLVIGTLVAGIPVYAHHSFAAYYFEEQSITISGVRDMAPPVSAQAAATRVVIAGLDVEGGALPVAIAGQTATAGRMPLRPLQVGISGVLPMEVRGVVKIEADRPVKIEADRPLRVESVPYTPGARPGE